MKLSRLWIVVPLSALLVLTACHFGVISTAASAISGAKTAHDVMKPKDEPKKPTTRPTKASLSPDQVEVLGAVDPNVQALFNPMPLRVSTAGSTTYHQPFCKYAMQSLVRYGPSKRVNYFSIQSIPANYTPCQYCMADVYDFPSSMSPAEFIRRGQEVYPVVRREHQGASAPAGTVVCQWKGYIAVAVPPEACEQGTINAIAGTPLQINTFTFNGISLGIGDANQDGKVDAADFPYLVAAYSGTNPATPVAQALFDFNRDGKVDMADFQSWFSELGSGNNLYAAQFWPTAVEAGETPMHPVRVSIQGSNKYHMPDCPAVKRSWDTYGYDKAIGYFSWDEVEKSGKTPDTVGGTSGCNATRRLP